MRGLAIVAGVVTACLLTWPPLLAPVALLVSAWLLIGLHALLVGDA